MYPGTPRSVLVTVAIIVVCLLGLVLLIFILSTCGFVHEPAAPDLPPNRWRRWRRRTASAAAVQLEEVENGIDDAVLDKYPEVLYKPVEGHGSSSCFICLVEFKENEEIRVLPECDHRFHVKCADSWLKTHSCCPVCRRNQQAVVPEPVVKDVTALTN